MSNPEQEFQSTMATAGLTPPDHIIADGKIHRFSTNGKPRDDSGWYMLHLDGIPAGAFGCWREGFTQNWCAKSDNTMTEGERVAYRERTRAMQVQRETERRSVTCQRHLKLHSDGKMLLLVQSIRT